MSPKRKQELRRAALRFASVVLDKEADGAEMPDPRSDAEDEYLRGELRNIAVDLLEQAT